VAGALLLHGLLATLYAVNIPAWNAPDEPAHFNYARDLARGQLPVLRSGDWDTDLLERLKADRFPATEPIDSIRYEGHQPPLYYAVMAPVQAMVANLPVGRQAIALRLATVLIGVAAVGAIFLVAREIAPGDLPLQIASAALAAVIPMRIAVAGTVSNDALAELVVSLTLWRGLIELRGSGGKHHPMVLGALAGFALLTKLSAYIAVVLVFASIVFGNGHDRWRRLADATLAAAALSAWWFIRNVMTYGLTDPFGLKRHAEVVVGQPETGPLTISTLALAAQTGFRSFWGQFGWMGVLIDSRLYLLFGALTALVALGVVLAIIPGGSARHASLTTRRGAAFLALAVILVGIGVVSYNMTYMQPQGRYLFPALAPLAIGAAFGLRELINPRHYGRVMGLLVLGFAGLDIIILYQYILPDLVR
jgi:4-amino-4-deoxy-L-arabinose transferase-like glycosyltransferase